MMLLLEIMLEVPKYGDDTLELLHSLKSWAYAWKIFKFTLHHLSISVDHDKGIEEEKMNVTLILCEAE